MSATGQSLLWGLAGGALIGLSASVLLLGLGQIAGISGIIGRLLQDRDDPGAWRVPFLVGLVLAGGVGATLTPERFGTTEPRSIVLIALAGLLVGFGTRVGNGCTSGHGVCGISRFSLRGMSATVVFILTGALTVATVNALGGAQ